jgi:hypothetical protein
MFILAQPDGPEGSEGSSGKTGAGTRAAGEAKACAACGASFLCYARCAPAGEAPCWCSQISLREETLARLREQYRDCLCEACLRKAAASQTNSAPD